MANQRNKKRHAGAKATAATAILLAALAGGSYGFRHSGLNIPGVQNNDKKGSPVQESTVTEQASVQDDGTLIVTVRNADILYRGSEVSLSQLETLLLSDYTAEKQIILQDDHAIKATFDEVTALLAKLSMPYTAE